MFKNRNVAVFFHYFEASEIYRDNLVFFLSTACSKDMDFYVIISGDCSVLLPDLDNIKYIYTENKNNDFGGYISALSKLAEGPFYDFYIFINSSVRGPFLGFNHKGSWVELFLNKFTDDVHLVGSSINVISSESPHSQRFGRYFDYEKPFSHIQTTAYALSGVAMRHLVNIGFYSVDEVLSKDDVICRYEIRLSQEIKRNGWDFKCFLSKYNEIDYRKYHVDPNDSSVDGDSLYYGSYFGRTARPYELIFVKTNRNVFEFSRLHFYTYLSLIRVARKEIREWSEFRSLKVKTIAGLKKSVKDNLKNKVVLLFKKFF